MPRLLKARSRRRNFFKKYYTGLTVTSLLVRMLYATFIPLISTVVVTDLYFLLQPADDIPLETAVELAPLHTTTSTNEVGARENRIIRLPLQGPYSLRHVGFPLMPSVRHAAMQIARINNPFL